MDEITSGRSYPCGVPCDVPLSARCIKRDEVTGSAAGRHETARLEAFSDGVIAIAITILALELRIPKLEEITSAKLVTAVLSGWPSYFAFVLSFTTILIMWINHHARMALIERTDGLLLFGNGLLMMM